MVQDEVAVGLEGWDRPLGDLIGAGRFLQLFKHVSERGRKSGGQRANSVLQLADEAMLFYAIEVDPGTPDWDEQVTTALRMRASMSARPGPM